MPPPAFGTFEGPWAQITRRRGVSAWPAPWHGQPILTFQLLRGSGPPPSSQPLTWTSQHSALFQPPVHMCVLLFHVCLWPPGVIAVTPEQDGI